MKLRKKEESEEINFDDINDSKTFEEQGGFVFCKEDKYKWVMLDFGDTVYYGTTSAPTLEASIETGAKLHAARLEYPIIALNKSDYSITVERGTNLLRLGRDKSLGYKHPVAVSFPIGTIRMIAVGDILSDTIKGTFKSKGVLIIEKKKA